jgi:hypothetical protein
MSQLERSPYHNCLHARLSLFTDYQARPLEPLAMDGVAGAERVVVCAGRWGHPTPPVSAHVPTKQADIKQLPTEPGQVLEEHSSEVWCIAFSPDGRWAASGSKDGSALLWWARCREGG